MLSHMVMEYLLTGCLFTEHTQTVRTIFLALFWFYRPILSPFIWRSL